MYRYTRIKTYKKKETHGTGLPQHSVMHIEYIKIGTLKLCRNFKLRSARQYRSAGVYYCIIYKHNIICKVCMCVVYVARRYLLRTVLARNN